MNIYINLSVNALGIFDKLSLGFLDMARNITPASGTI